MLRCSTLGKDDTLYFAFVFLIFFEKNSWIRVFNANCQTLFSVKKANYYNFVSRLMTDGETREIKTAGMNAQMHKTYVAGQV